MTPLNRPENNITFWPSVLDTTLFGKSHFRDEIGAFFVVAAHRHNDFCDLAHVERVVEYRRQIFRCDPSFDCNVTPDALVVPVLVNDTGNDLTAPESDCLTAFCKISTLHSFCNPLANLDAFNDITQSIPPPSNTRSVATHCNWMP